MNSFTFSYPTKVYFGEGSAAQAFRTELRKKGKTVLLAYGGGSVKKNGVYDEVKALLKQADKTIIDFSGIMPNPTYAKVQEGAAIAREQHVDFILAVGGGSVIDCCKVISAQALLDEDIWEMEYGKGQFPNAGIPVGAVVTASGTGAEMNAGGVITHEEKKWKGGIFGIAPVFAVLDPAYTMSVPPMQVLSGAFDTLSHAMETYFGNSDQDNVSDDVALAVMRNTVVNMRRLLKNINDRQVRSNLMWDSAKWVSGKDVILHIIGLIGVDGALYKSMEFVGEGIKYLSMDDRFTIANMAIEAGGKNGIFPVDDLTVEYMKEHSKRPYKVYEADEDAVYEQEYTIDLGTLKSTIAFPHLPENTKTIDEITEDVVIDQSVIGSCTNGRIEDLRCAAEILKGRKVKKGVRCIVIPATQQIYLQAMREGLLEIFIEAGAVVSTPTCGPCLGGYMGILAEGERCISTTNRNFVGRMGHVKSEVYLASPAVAAASAVTGKISAPAELGL